MNLEGLNKTAFNATVHCLTGCAIGEVLGMIISTALKWSAITSVVISIVLAFVFGYALSVYSLLKSGVNFKPAVGTALAADTVSIGVMEITDNAFILIIPGAIHAGLNTWLFWISLAVSLLVAFAAAFPVNRYLISKGKGHALAHKHHHH